MDAQKPNETVPATIDPVCGMRVDPEKPASIREYEGERYFFCCKHCAEKFNANPEQYLNAKAKAATGLVQLGGVPAKVIPKPVKASAPTGAKYFCPMDPEVISSTPGSCPKCGMAFEPEIVTTTGTQYVCPMHPDVVSDKPGACPKCGMALEPRVASSASVEDDGEVRSMSRRFWIGTAITFPLLAISMGGMLTSGWLHEFDMTRGSAWLQLLLAAPVVLWGGAPFFERGWNSLRTRNLNMFTLIAMGTGVAFFYSLLVTILPASLLPQIARGESRPDVYFEVSAAITVLVLLGQVMELRARRQTSTAIRAPAIVSECVRGKRSRSTARSRKGRAASTSRW